MKKTLIALAAVAVSTGALAQATLSGNISFGQDSRNGFSNQIGVIASDFTLSATEDLGGGLTASGSMMFDAAAHSARGNSTAGLRFADRSMSLAGGFGTVTLASTRSSNLAIGGAVFGTNLAATATDLGLAGRTNGNVVGYTSPAFSGIRVNASIFYANQTAATSSTTNTASSAASLNSAAAPAGAPDNAAQVATSANQQVRVTTVGATYADGPLSVAVAHKTNNASARAMGLNTRASVTEMNGSYDLGVARVGLGYATGRFTGESALTVMGVNAPLSSELTVGANFGQRGGFRFQELGATYAFSPRTNATLHTGTFRTAAGEAQQRQTRLALRHAF